MKNKFKNLKKFLQFNFYASSFSPQAKSSKLTAKSYFSGFTLIEMMVATALFAVVMVVAVGALLSVVSANRKALAQQTVINNLNFAIEGMSRAIRAGSTYHCDITTGTIDTPQDCQNQISGANSFAFEGPFGDPLNPNDQIVYRLNNNRVERSDSSGQLNTYYALTAPELVVEGLNFYLSGASEPANDTQPYVVMILYGYANLGPNSRVDFNLHTSITQRVLDY